MSKTVKVKSKNKSKIMTQETWGMVLVLMAILCSICVITKSFIFGNIGLYVDAFLLGVFGYLTYGILIAMIYLGFTMVTGKKFSVSGKMILGLFLILISIISILHIFTTQSFLNGNYGEYLKNCYLQGEKGISGCSGGGVFFGLFIFPITKLLSNIGGYVLFSVLMVVSLLFIFNVFFPVNFKQSSQKANLKNKNEPAKNIPIIDGEKDYPIQNVNFENLDTPKTDESNKLFVGSEDFDLKSKKQLKNSTINENLKILYPTLNTQSNKQDPQKNSSAILFESEIPKDSYTNNYQENLKDKIDYIMTPPQISPKQVTFSGEEKKESIRNEENRRPPKFVHEQKNNNLEGISFSGDKTDLGFNLNNRRNKTNTSDLFNIYVDDTTKKNDEVIKSSGKPIINAEELSSKLNKTRNLPASDSSNDLELNAIGFDNEEIKPIKNNDIFNANDFDNKEIKSIKNSDIFNTNDFDNKEIKSIKNSDIFNTNDFVDENKIFSDEKPLKSKLTNYSEEVVEKNVNNEEKPIIALKPYTPPPVDLLDIRENVIIPNEEYEEKGKIIERTLNDFGIPAKVQSVVVGPSITRYELDMPAGITVRRVPQYTDDIAMNLASINGVRIEAPIPGKHLVGIEVPNVHKSIVSIRDTITTKEFINSKPTSLMFALGKGVTGNTVLCDLTKMPHLLVAGSTGSGKSACLNSLIISLIYKYSPEELRLILVDPKLVEFNMYSGIPHLMINEIVTNANKAIGSLSWAITEMDKRYELFSEYSVHNIDEYNFYIDSKNEKKLPKIVIIVDELADLMMFNKKELEDRIMKLTQKARAAGIHLVLATQRPSVDIITGVIKANLPSRIAFKVAQFQDSRVILDEQGAEKLLGAGDMLYRSSTMEKPERIQGSFITTEEVKKVVNFVKLHNPSYFDEKVASMISNPKGTTTMENSSNNDTEIDQLFIDALRYVVSCSMASISMVQRKFSIGYTKAGKIIDKMEEMGYISKFDGAKSRQILISKEEFESKYGTN